MIYYTTNNPIVKPGLKLEPYKDNFFKIQIGHERIIIGYLKFKKWLDEGYIKAEKTEISIDQIISVICTYENMNIDVIHAKTRKREIVEARQIAHALTKTYTTKSLSDIGWEIGKVDHATVLHSIKTVENLAETNAAYRNKVNEIEAML